MHFKNNPRKCKSVNPDVLKRIAACWNRHEKKILEKVYNLTGMRLETKHITCYLDASTPHGMYGHRTIYLGTRGGLIKDDILMVIAHELFHIFYWRKIKKDGLTKSELGKETRNEWKLAEVTAYLVTNEPLLRKIWPTARVYLYPEIKEIYKMVKKFWRKRDFNFFLQNAYAKIK